MGSEAYLAELDSAPVDFFFVNGPLGGPRLATRLPGPRAHRKARLLRTRAQRKDHEPAGDPPLARARRPRAAHDARNPRRPNALLRPPAAQLRHLFGPDRAREA